VRLSPLAPMPLFRWNKYPSAMARSSLTSPFASEIASSPLQRMSAAEKAF